MKNPLNQKCRGAMRYAHEAYGFDFQKPYILHEGYGTFTHKSIKKSISCNFDDGICLLFMSYPSSLYSNFKCIRVRGDKFDREVVNPHYFCGDDFFRCNEMEYERKSFRGTYFVIFQLVEHLDSHIMDTDYKLENGVEIRTYSPYVAMRHLGANKFTRFYAVNHRYGYFMQSHDGSIPKFRIDSRFNIDFGLDKSGYSTTIVRTSLNDRLIAHKKKKDREYDYSAQEKIIEAQLEKLRAFLCKELENMDFETACVFERVSMIFATNFRNFSRHKTGEHYCSNISEHTHYLYSISEKLEETIIRYNI